MSRKTKERKLGPDDKWTVIISELTVGQIKTFVYGAIEGIGSNKKPEEEEQNKNNENAIDSISELVGIDDDIKKLFPHCVSGIEWKDLDDLTPSELKGLYSDFREVNSVFFEMARTLGLTPMLEEMIRAVGKDFSKILSDSFSSATETS